MKKITFLIINCVFIFAFWVNSVYGTTNTQVNLSSDKNIVKKGEEIEIVLSLANAKTAAFTAYIYFDDSYFEYVKGPKLSNLDNNRIIYVWYDENGVGNSKNGELARFTFKAKNDGVSNFSVNGEFFDEDGDLIETNFKDFEVRIGEEPIENAAENIEVLSEDIDDSNNTNLETLAVENMLLYPPFDNNVTSYDFEVPNDVTDLNILAVPENENAKVKINGGDDLKEGDNSIKITVTAKNGNTQKVYNLNAYRRNKEEEANYLKEQEENKKKLEEIYNTQKTSTEVEVVEESKETGSKKSEVQESNAWFIVLVAIGMIFVGGIVVYIYK